MRRALYSLVLSLAMPLAAAAQPGGTITGQVTDPTGSPIPGAHVILLEAQLGGATDSAGRFRIPHVPDGSHRLAVTAIGFERAERTIAAQAAAVTVVDFVLNPATTMLDEMVVRARESLTRGPAGVRDLPGSAHYIGPEQLRTHADTDILRVLREIPGVNIQEEEGYGLRPNIGLRGTGSERSSKITVMEDGVLIAPAPYAAPAAYYFPTVGRMSGIEVRKGASQIKFGPYTTGGALNLISTPIPPELAGFAEASIGQNDARNVHLHLGNTYRNVAFILETHQSNAAGFKHIFPLQDLDTGFDTADYLAKARVNTSPGAAIYQSLTLKVARHTEVSHETYLGLTADDFAATPFRRYAASQVDRMDARQGQLQLRHVAVLSSAFDVTTTAYRNTFSRNWYKLDAVHMPDGPGASLGAVLGRPDAHAAELALLKGALGDGGLEEARLVVRGNDRQYVSEGLQTIAGMAYEFGSTRTELELGLRLHRDQMDRFQADDLFAMTDARMVLVDRGAPGSESNRLEWATALAAFAQAEITLGRWVLVPGLRYEHITLGRDDYGKNDPERTGIELKTSANSVDVLVPGLAVQYRLGEGIAVFAGAHRGFAPPTSQEGVRPETSVNYELGLRYDTRQLAAQVTTFFNDYDNLLGSDLAAGGGTGSTDLFNGGEVHVLGVEASASANVAQALGLSDVRLPLRLVYTFTDAGFRSSFESSHGPWGMVTAGDELPYVARHQLGASAGAAWSRYSLDARLSHVGTRRIQAGQGDIPEHEKLPAHLVVDLSGEVALSGGASVFALVRNVFDDVYVASMRPAGYRPGLPRTLSAGVRASF